MGNGWFWTLNKLDYLHHFKKTSNINPKYLRSGYIRVKRYRWCIVKQIKLPQKLENFSFYQISSSKSLFQKHFNKHSKIHRLFLHKIITEKFPRGKHKCQNLWRLIFRTGAVIGRRQEGSLPLLTYQVFTRLFDYF